MNLPPFNLERALAGDEVVADLTHHNRITKYRGFHQMPNGQIVFEKTDILGHWEITWARVAELHNLLYMKPRTITVNGFEIAAPESEEPELNSTFYIPQLTDENLFSNTLNWGTSYSYKWRRMLLERGLVHLTKENAITHAKAMLGIDPNDR